MRGCEKIQCCAPNNSYRQQTKFPAYSLGFCNQDSSLASPQSIITGKHGKVSEFAGMQMRPSRRSEGSTLIFLSFVVNPRLVARSIVLACASRFIKAIELH